PPLSRLLTTLAAERRARYASVRSGSIPGKDRRGHLAWPLDHRATLEGAPREDSSLSLDPPREEREAGDAIRPGLSPSALLRAATRPQLASGLGVCDRQSHRGPIVTRLRAARRVPSSRPTLSRWRFAHIPRTLCGLPVPQTKSPGGLPAGRAVSPPFHHATGERPSFLHWGGERSHVGVRVVGLAGGVGGRGGRRGRRGVF